MGLPIIYMESDISPCIDKLRAFRVNEYLRKALNGEIPEPVVKVLPNFEIYIHSPFYPAKLISRLSPLAEVASEDKTVVMKLQKRKVAQHLAKHEGMDVVGLLKELSSKDIPQNVVVELEEWAGHSEKFTLFDGFSLLEGDTKPPIDDGLIAEKISGHIRIIKNPEKVYDVLEKAELVPFRIKHSDSSLYFLPEKFRTVFPQKSKAKPKPKKKRPAVLKREIQIILKFPNKELLEQFCQKALTAHCVFEVDSSTLEIIFAKDQETAVNRILGELKKDFLIKVEDN